MDYQQFTETCFANVIGEQGLRDSDYQCVLGESEASLDVLREAQKSEKLPLLNLPKSCSDFAETGRYVVSSWLGSTNG